MPEKRSLSHSLIFKYSSPFTQIYVNEVVLGTLFGILIGPYFAGVFDPRSWASKSDEITLEVMRVVLATGLFAIGVELPKSYMAKHAKSLLAMVIPTMAIGWIVVAGLYFLLSLMYLQIHCSPRSSLSFISSITFYILLGYLCLLDAYGSSYLRCYCW